MFIAHLSRVYNRKSSEIYGDVSSIVERVGIPRADREGATRVVQKYNQSEITTGSNWGTYYLKRFVCNGMEGLIC